jgi:hypothetical protein
LHQQKASITQAMSKKREGPPKVYLTRVTSVIQVDIGGHPPFPTGSKQFSGNFGNLLFLAVFNFRGHFEALNDVFGKIGRNMEVP